MTATPIAGRNVLVMGLGSFGGGLGATRFLAREGARVTVTDLRDATELEEALPLESTLSLSGAVIVGDDVEGWSLGMGVSF